MVRIVTVAREYGSGGAEIARLVANFFGWDLVDRTLIDSVAKYARVPVSVAREYDERAESWKERILAGFVVPVPEIYGAPPPDDIVDAKSIHALTEHAIRTAAVTGSCVIVGRAAQCVLHGRSDTLNVFVYAPIEARIERLKKRHPEGTDVRKLISDVDHERAAYIHQYYHCNREDRSLYGLCVNSALGIDITASLIEQAAKLAGNRQ